MLFSLLFTKFFNPINLGKNYTYVCLNKYGKSYKNLNFWTNNEAITLFFITSRKKRDSIAQHFTLGIS